MEDPFSIQTNVPALVSSVRVPNVLPTVTQTYRLAIVGEAPGETEESLGYPFAGASGRFLDEILSGVGIVRSACFLGNVCQYRPPGNDINEFGYSHEKVLSGWSILQQELREYKPNCTLLLGNTPLYFFTGQSGIKSWRGSILPSPLGKTVAALHPAFVLREYRQRPLLIHDIRRALQESFDPTYTPPNLQLELNLSASEICYRLDNWPAGRLLSFDIEGGIDAFPCCSVAGESSRGFIIAWSQHSDEDQGRIARSLSRALWSETIPKVLQNSLYDRFVLAYKYRMLIRNVVEDTMDKQWAIYSELPKNLGTIASIWTTHPYYKYERKTDNPDTFYEYCIKDSCVTLESCRKMDDALSPQERAHYEFNVRLKNPLLYMELRGIQWDSTQAALELAQCNAAMAEIRSRMELRIQPMQFTKKEFSSNITGTKGSISSTRLAKVLYDQMGYPEQMKGKGENRRRTTDVEAILNLAYKKPNDPFLADILLHRKLEGVVECLEWKPDPLDGRMKCSYNQFSKGEDNAEEGGGATDTGRLRCGQTVIPVGDKFVGGNLQTVTKKLRKLLRADLGRDLFQCDLAGADGWTVAARCLSFGDSTMWEDYMAGLKPAKIIALMYTYGPDVVNRLSRAELFALSEQESAPGKCCDGDGWLYFGCKRVQHGSNYGMQGKTMSVQIMKDSYKITGRAVYVPVDVCEALQRLYFLRYKGLYQWHEWCKQQVFSGANLTSASGHTRRFFGRRKSWSPKLRRMECDHDTWKQFLADEPQENTTHATNLALDNLWTDEENRLFSYLGVGSSAFLDRSLRVGGQEAVDYFLSRRSSFLLLSPQEQDRTAKQLIVEPLHQVHDALLGQNDIAARSWAVPKIESWFDNELTIAGTQVRIPFEGAFGPSWGELGPKYGGGKIGRS